MKGQDFSPGFRVQTDQKSLKRVERVERAERVKKVEVFEGVNGWKKSDLLTNEPEKPLQAKGRKREERDPRTPQMSNLDESKPIQRPNPLFFLNSNYFLPNIQMCAKNE